MVNTIFCHNQYFLPYGNFPIGKLSIEIQNVRKSFYLHEIHVFLSQRNIKLSEHIKEFLKFVLIFLLLFYDRNTNVFLIAIIYGIVIIFF